MENQEGRKISKEFQKGFMKNPYWLFLADGFIGHDGIKRISLNAIHKAVYLHMILKYQHFHKLGKLYYETHDQIASAVGVSVSTVKRSIDLFEDEGVIKVNRVRGRGVNKNIYVSIKKLDTFFYIDTVDIESESDIVVEHTQTSEPEEDVLAWMEG